MPDEKTTGYRRDVGGEQVVQVLSGSTPGAVLDIGAFALKSVHVLDNDGSFAGSCTIQVSNTGNTASASEWVAANGGSGLNKGALVNITEDALYGRVKPTLTAGEAKIVWYLTG